MKIICFFILALFSISTFAQGGGISGGGDSFAAEFVKIGYDISQMLEKDPIEEISANEFLTAVQTTQVNSAYTVVLNGEEVDAINTPSLKHILINRRRWIDTVTDYKKRFVLVAHEYLGILGVQDSKYQISHKIFKKQNGILKGQYSCDVPVYITETYVLETIKLDLAVYRKEYTEVNITKEIIQRAIPTFVVFQAGAIDYKTFDISIDILITLDLGKGLAIVRLPYEIYGKPIQSGEFKVKMFLYPQSKEIDVSCKYIVGEKQ